MSRDIDNFDRQVWMLIGTATGIAITAFWGWIFAVCWAGGWGLAWLLALAVMTGRVRIERKRGSQ